MQHAALQKIYKAKVFRTETVAHGAEKITFRVDEPFAFYAGQYVWIEIPKLKAGDPKGNRRAFSICSIPNKENTISILARISDSGYKQSLFALVEDDEVVVHGPFGSSFVLGERDPLHIIMIAGGVGIAAMLPTIEAIQQSSPPITCFLVYLNKNKERAPFLSELEELKKKSSFFDYKSTYEHFSWDDVRIALADIKGHTEWWIAGPQAMVNHVYTTLEAGGVSRLNMVFENFYPLPAQNLSFEKIKEQFEKEGILMQALQNSTNHTIITDANGVVLFANKAAEQITGYSQKEILGNTPRLWGGMMDAAFYKDFWAKKLAGEPFVGEITNRRKNGETYYSIAHISPIFGENKEVIGHIGTEEDITNRVALEKKIAESENFLNSIVENIPNMIFVKDAKKFKFVLFNKAGEELVGHSAADMLGKSDYDFFQKEQADFFIDKDREVFARGQMVDIPEEPIETKYKGTRTLHTKKIPILDTDGNPKYLLGISEDITEMKQNQKKLEEQNEELGKINKVLVGRELKMIELKEELRKLKEGS